MYMFLYNLIILFIISMLLFISHYKNILMTLISLEFMFMNTIYMMYLIFMFLKIELFFMIFILTMMICESVLGLSIMIYMIRSVGNDYMNLLNILKW